MVFEYLSQEVFTKQLDLVDPGNSAICCRDKDFNEYYILMTTVFGKTHVLRYGPIVPDLDTLSDNFSVYYKKMDYNEQKIQKEINNLLNDTKKNIVDAEELPTEIAIESFPMIAEMYKNVGDDEI